jgi:hypothetical protein
MEETNEDRNEDNVEVIISVKVVEVFDTDDPHFDVYFDGEKVRRIDLDDETKKYIKQRSA